MAGTVSDTAGVFARPFVLDDPQRLTYILDKLCEHRPWFDDFVWENPQARRNAASGYLVDALLKGALWEVWKGPQLVGIAMLNRLHFNNDAQCHFVFFDHKLADKRQLCLNLMAWAFEHYQLQTLRIEIPTYARFLANWARKALSFRYEAEGRPFSWAGDYAGKPLTEEQAMLGSRKHRAALYKAKWHDALLLSITREEFASQHGWTQHRTSGRPDGTVAGTDTGGGEHARRLSGPAEDTGDSGPVRASPTDERPSAATR